MKAKASIAGVNACMGDSGGDYEKEQRRRRWWESRRKGKRQLQL